MTTMLVVTRDVDSPVGCSYRMVAVGLDNLIKYILIFVLVAFSGNVPCMCASLHAQFK